jgi:hypothetical protein
VRNNREQTDRLKNDLNRALFSFKNVLYKAEKYLNFASSEVYYVVSIIIAFKILF